MNDSQDIRFLYIGDPMCSWCWGFAPVLDALQDTFNIPLDIKVGGLRPGPSAEELDEKMRGFLAHHWHQVHEASGQPFDEAGLNKPAGWKYDTELACIAVVTMRELANDQTLRWFGRVKRAFYAENVDVTDPRSYPDLLSDFPVDPDRFVELLTSAEMKRKAWEDFSFARKLDVNGFPTLLIQDGSKWVMASPGYAPADTLIPAIKTWLETEKPQLVTGLVCDLDGNC